MALSLTWISFSLRFYVRTRILKFIGREDWLMIASMVRADHDLKSGELMITDSFRSF
jgi:hypothetical protein